MTEKTIDFKELLKEMPYHWQKMYEAETGKEAMFHLHNTVGEYYESYYTPEYVDHITAKLSMAVGWIESVNKIKSIWKASENSGEEHQGEMQALALMEAELDAMLPGLIK